MTCFISTSFSLLLLLLANSGITSLAQTQVQQLGSSGKFRISNEQGASDPNRVTVEVDSVFEIPTASTDHGNPTMANQDFTVSGVTAATVGNDVAASKITFTTTLQTNGNAGTTYGTLVLDTYIIEEAGTVTTDTETFDVNPNDVKFNIVLSDWTFDTASEFVDVALIIKGRANDGDVEERQPNIYDLGGSVPLILSGRVVVDGTETEMPAGYPRFIQTGNKYTFEFRFPKFTDTAVYDPIAGYSTAGNCFFPYSACGNALRSVRSYLGGIF